MDEDRYNRDTRRNDYNMENRRTTSSSSRGDSDRSGSDWNRDDNRRDYGDDNRQDYGSGSAYGSSRDDYGSRGSMSDRGYGGGQGSGGYDEWSRRGNRSLEDRYQTYDRNRLDLGGSERSRSFGDSGRSSHGGYGSDRSRDYGNRDYGYGGQSGSDRFSSGSSYGGGERGYSQGGRGFWDKASDEVSSWFGDRDAERRREQDEHRGRGPKNYSRSDDRIKEDVNDRLTDDNYLDASDIEVSVKDREVTLSGTVSDRNAKRRAEDVAEGVSGVSHVQNNIRVKSNSSTGSSMGMGSSGTGSSSTTGSTSMSGSSATSVDVDRSTTTGSSLGAKTSTGI